MSVRSVSIGSHVNFSIIFFLSRGLLDCLVVLGWLVADWHVGYGTSSHDICLGWLLDFVGMTLLSDY